jgi:lipopolysaccharide transport system ATP-binding protein
MSSDTAISASHISKRYDLGLTGRARGIGTSIKQRLRHPINGGLTRERFLALDDVSFDVEPGEAVGVIGRNGAGKSTLLKILSRITKPSAGHVDMSGSVGSLLEVGTGFHPELTGRENVYLNGAILGMSTRDIDRRLDEILEFAEVDKFLETPVKRYSSGMRVRLAFAVAAHLDPEILIIDEVLSVGDHSFQVKCLDKMRSIASDEGRTVLYVSHNLVTVENLCARALLLVDGQLAFDGPTEETVAQYLHQFPHAESDTPGVFDLSAAERSVPGHKAVFKRVEIRGADGAPSNTIRMGGRMQIEIDVEGLDSMSDPSVTIEFGLGTARCLFRFSSRMFPLDATHTRRSAETIVLDVPSLPLIPRDYTMKLLVKDGPEILDHVPHAAEFTVVSADLCGNGYPFGSYDGDFIVPWSWELRPAAAERARPSITDRDETATAERDDLLLSLSRHRTAAAWGFTTAHPRSG